MRIFEADAYWFRFKPLFGALPWILIGTAVTFLIAVVILLFPWIPDPGPPVVVRCALTVGGAAALIFLVPSQIRWLLAELFGHYTIDADISTVTIQCRYFGLQTRKQFSWSEIAWIGIQRVGMPQCEIIRIDLTKGYWFSFGMFFDSATRREAIECLNKAHPLFQNDTT